MKEFFYVEWSEQQKSFHIDNTKNGLVKLNLEKFTNPKDYENSDWMIIGIFKSPKEAMHFCDKWEKLRKDDIKKHFTDLIKRAHSAKRSH